MRKIFVVAAVVGLSITASTGFAASCTDEMKQANDDKILAMASQMLEIMDERSKLNEEPVNGKYGKKFCELDAMLVEHLASEVAFVQEVEECLTPRYGFQLQELVPMHDTAKKGYERWC